MAENTELIVKFNGDIISVCKNLDAFAEIVECNYAVVTIPIKRIDELYNYSEVEYYEMSKIAVPVSALKTEMGSTGISFVKDSSYNLNGNGVIIGIIDSGIDFTHSEFLNNDGSSRILYIWDQNIEGKTPDGFLFGSEYNSNDINSAINSEKPFEMLPSRDLNGHGTAVAGIAAGNSGIASEASIVSVKLSGGDLVQTTAILRAIKYITDKAVMLNMPVSINISYGMNDGSHNGNSLFEQCINSMCEKWKTSISVATGNEGGAGHHFSSVLKSGQTVEADFGCQAPSGILFADIWKSFNNNIEFELIAPNGVSSGTIDSRDYMRNIRFGGMNILVNYKQVTHYTDKQEIVFLFGGESSAFISGIWKIIINCISAVDGRIDIWLPTVTQIGEYTKFLDADEDFTLTLPSTVYRVISVGGFNSSVGSLASFSGRGIRSLDKPDIVAPAVNIVSARAGGGMDSYSGTSMASPFVCGSAALMMEWGIVKKNKPFLYGQMIKAFLIKGAKRDKNITYPDNGWGYGTLDLKRSIELLEASL